MAGLFHMYVIATTQASEFVEIPNLGCQPD